MKRFFFSFLSAFFMLAVQAQNGDGATDINVDINPKGSASWYANPVIWVVGAAVFILLLVALLRGGRRS